MTSEGYVKLHRRIEESDVWDNPNTLKVFLWCLLRANYTKRAIRFGGEAITLQPGEFISGRFAAAKECKMSPSTWRDQILYLCRTGAIRSKSDNKKTVFTVVNWARFQCEVEKPDNNPTAETGLSPKSPTTRKTVFTVVNRVRLHGKADKSDNDPTTARHRQESKKGRKRADGEEHAVPPPEDGEGKGGLLHGDDSSASKKNGSAVSEFVGFFSAEHLARRGSKYAVHRGRDHAAAKSMIDSLGLEECKARAVRYLTREDKWTHEHGFSIGNMLAVINGLGGNGKAKSEAVEFLRPDQVKA
jgi:hypothetical protein